MSYSARFVLAGLTCSVLAWGSIAQAVPVGVSGITYLPLSDGNFQLPTMAAGSPAELAGDAGERYLSTGVPGTSRGNRSDRDLGQSFTISNPSGLDIGGFVIQYMAAPASATLTFDVELFPVANATATTLTASGDLIVADSGLEFETPHSNGTAIFVFDNTIHLPAGSYAWRMPVPGSDLTNLFQWAPTSSTDGHAAGRKYENNTSGVSTGGSGDFYFAFIQPVPEPSSCIILSLGILGVGLLNLRRRK